MNQPQKHFTWAIVDAIANFKTVTYGLYKVDYKNTSKGLILTFFDTNFKLGVAVINPMRDTVDIRLSMIAKEWQVEIIKRILQKSFPKISL